MDVRESTGHLCVPGAEVPYATGGGNGLLTSMPLPIAHIRNSCACGRPKDTTAKVADQSSRECKNVLNEIETNFPLLEGCTHTGRFRIKS